MQGTDKKTKYEVILIFKDVPSLSYLSSSLLYFFLYAMIFLNSIARNSPRQNKDLNILFTPLPLCPSWEKKMEDLLNRITFDKDVLCGKPLIRGLRISIEMILELLAKGATEREILEDYPELQPDDIRAALIYAHCMVATEEVFDRIKTR